MFLFTAVAMLHGLRAPCSVLHAAALHVNVNGNGLVFGTFERFAFAISIEIFIPIMFHISLLSTEEVAVIGEL